MAYEFKKLNDVEIIETPIDTANVLIEEDGVIKKAPKSAVGGGGNNNVFVGAMDTPFADFKNAYDEGKFVYVRYLTESGQYQGVAQRSEYNATENKNYIQFVGLDSENFLNFIYWEDGKWEVNTKSFVFAREDELETVAELDVNFAPHEWKENVYVNNNVLTPYFSVMPGERFVIEIGAGTTIDSISPKYGKLAMYDGDTEIYWIYPGNMAMTVKSETPLSVEKVTIKRRKKPTRTLTLAHISKSELDTFLATSGTIFEREEYFGNFRVATGMKVNGDSFIAGLFYVTHRPVKHGTVPKFTMSSPMTGYNIPGCVRFEDLISEDGETFDVRSFFIDETRFDEVFPIVSEGWEITMSEE